MSELGAPGSGLVGLDLLWLIPLVLLLGLGLKMVLLKNGVRLGRRLGASQRELPPVTIILRVRNLEQGIEGLVRCIFALEDRSKRTIQLLVVDDRSGDQTPLIVSRLTTRYPGMLFLNSNTGAWQEQPAVLAKNYARYPLVMYLNLKPPVNYLRVTAKIERYLQELGDGRGGPPRWGPADLHLEWVRWKV